MSNNKVKEYKGEEVTVIWKQHKCIHSAKCVRNLPGVFMPQERPWVKINNAGTEQLIDAVDQCPSKALTWKYNDQEDFEKELNEAIEKNTDVNILKDGPILIKGKFEITDSKGNVLEAKESAALCRCGASENKPFCDGNHKNIGFKA